MRINIFARVLLAVLFGTIGILIVRIVPPPELFFALGDSFFLVAALAFGILGFISPDLLRLAGRAGMVALASQIARYLPGANGIGVPNLIFSKRNKFSKKASKFINPMLVDTSVLIDGRFNDVARSGFVFGTLVIIPSVISELHMLSDSADEGKRSRGRRGLDNLNQLQKEKKVKVSVVSTEPKGDGVDEKLVKLAKSLQAKLVTVDFNLNKVARVNKITVLNINELANSVRTPILPQDNLTIKVVAVGRERDQGVGYLDDGTMVVIEGGANLVGKFANVTVSKVLQSSAGKMVFGKMSL